VIDEFLTVSLYQPNEFISRDFSYGRAAAVDEISTDVARRAAPLRQPTYSLSLTVDL